MRCPVCDRSMRGIDKVNFLPTARALVHRACYERETGRRPPLSHMFSVWLSCVVTATKAA
jgi:hypothetical protein